MCFRFFKVVLILLTVVTGQDVSSLPQYPNLCLNFVNSLQRIVNATSRNNGSPGWVDTGGQNSAQGNYRPSALTTPNRLVRRRCWQRFTSPAACSRFPELANNMYGVMSYLSYVYRECQAQHISHIQNGNFVTYFDYV